MISDFVRSRAAMVLPPRELENLRLYLLRLIEEELLPPRRGQAVDWALVGDECEIEPNVLLAASRVLQPSFDAITRYLGRRPSSGRTRAAPARHTKRGRASAPVEARPEAKPENVRADPPARRPGGARRGAKPKPIVEFPEPKWTSWQDPETFPEALRLHMERHGDNCWYLYRAVVRPGELFDRKTLLTWIRGTRAPRSVESLEVLGRIERRYRLPPGYFKNKLPNKQHSASGHQPAGISSAERRRLAWHLPDDFEKRSSAEQEEILNWFAR